MVMFKSTSHNCWFPILLYHQNVFLFVSNRIFFSVRESCDKSDPKQSISFLRYDIVSFHIFYCVNFMFLWMYLDLCFPSVCLFCQRRWLVTRKQGNRGDHLYSSLQYCVKRVQIRSFFLVCFFPKLDWIGENTDQKKIRIRTLFAQYNFHLLTKIQTFVCSFANEMTASLF